MLLNLLLNLLVNILRILSTDNLNKFYVEDDVKIDNQFVEDLKLEIEGRFMLSEGDHLVNARFKDVIV